MPVLDESLIPILDEVVRCNPGEVEFHQAVAAASPNALLRLVMVMVNQSLIPAANMISFQFRQRDRVVALQRRIFSAILTRDATEAVAAFDALIDYQSGVYQMAVDQREARQADDKTA